MNLWMRWVNFRILRDLLLLVAEFPGILRPSALDRLGAEKQVLISREGKPLGPTTRYHHRRTLERLGLIIKPERTYIPNDKLIEVDVLMTNKNLGTELNEKEKAAFANVVLRNEDCYEAFFRFFAAEKNADVGSFVASAEPIELRLDYDTSGPKPLIVIKQRGSKTEAMFNGANAVQAIHFGLRSWCVDQLSFMDDLYQAGVGYTVFAIDIKPTMPYSDLELKILNLLSFRDGWATFRVGDIALDAGSRFRVSISQVRSVLERWLKDYPGVVTGIPTNERFISGGLPDAQKEVVLKGFARERSGAYVSHIRVHQAFRNMIERRDVKS